MKSAFGMFSLTKGEQRVVIVIVLAIVVFALVQGYRESGTIGPASQPPAMSATPSPSDKDRDGR